MESLGSVDLVVTQDATKYAKIIAAKIRNEKQRKRAYASIIALDIFADYLLTQGIEVNITKNLFKIAPINEEFEIADLYYNGWKIDVRVAQDDFVSIPKAHFESGIAADFYIAIKLDKKLKKAKFMGVISKNKINTAISNNSYYLMNSDALEDIDILVNTIKKPGVNTIKEADHDYFKSFYMAYLDNDIQLADKKKMLQHLTLCEECRSDFVELYDFETIVANSYKYPEIFEDRTLDFIGGAAAEEEKYSGKEELIDISGKDEAIDGLDLLYSSNPSETLISGSSVLAEVVDTVAEVQNDFDTSFLDELAMDTAEYSSDSTESVLTDIPEEVIKEAGDKLLDFNDMEDTILSDSNGFAEEKIEEVFGSIDNLDNINIDDLDVIKDIEAGDMTNNLNTIDDISMDDLDSIDELADISFDDSDINNINIDISDAPNMSDIADIDGDNELIPIVDDEPKTLSENIQPKMLNLEDEEDFIDSDEDMLITPVQNASIKDIDLEDDFSQDFSGITSDLDIDSDIDLGDKDDFDVNTDTEELFNIDIDSEVNNKFIPDDLILGGIDEDVPEFEDFIGLAQEPELEFISEPQDIVSEPVAAEPSQYHNDNNEISLAASKKEVSANDSLQIEALYDDRVTPESYEFSNYTNNVDMSAKGQNNKMIILSSIIVSVVVFVTILGFALFSKANKQKTDEFNNNIMSQTDESMPGMPDADNGLGVVDSADSSYNGLVGSKTPKDMNKVMTNVFDENPSAVTVTKISWEVPHAIASNEKLSKYLQLAGKNLQLNLKNDLLNSTEFAYNDKMAVSIFIDKNNNIKNLEFSNSSGSEQIDDIVLQSIKETLKYINVPVLSEDEEKQLQAGGKGFKDNNYNFKLVINF